MYCFHHLVRIIIANSLGDHTVYNKDMKGCKRALRSYQNQHSKYQRSIPQELFLVDNRVRILSFEMLAAAAHPFIILSIKFYLSWFMIMC